MKAHVYRDKKGKAIAAVFQTAEDPALVPLDAEVDDQGDVEERPLRQRDLLDLDRLYKQISK